MLLQITFEIEFMKFKANYVFCRITAELECKMDLARYPMDEQICWMELESCEFHLVIQKHAGDSMKYHRIYNDFWNGL